MPSLDSPAYDFDTIATESKSTFSSNSNNKSRISNFDAVATESKNISSSNFNNKLCTSYFDTIATSTTTTCKPWEDLDAAARRLLESQDDDECKILTEAIDGAITNSINFYFSKDTSSDLRYLFE